LVGAYSVTTKKNNAIACRLLNQICYLRTIKFTENEVVERIVGPDLGDNANHAESFVWFALNPEFNPFGGFYSSTLSGKYRRFSSPRRELRFGTYHCSTTSQCSD